MKHRHHETLPAPLSRRRRARTARRLAACLAVLLTLSPVLAACDSFRPKEPDSSSSTPPSTASTAPATTPSETPESETTSETETEVTTTESTTPSETEPSTDTSETETTDTEAPDTTEPSDSEASTAEPSASTSENDPSDSSDPAVTPDPSDSTDPSNATDPSDTEDPSDIDEEARLRDEVRSMFPDPDTLVGHPDEVRLHIPEALLPDDGSWTTWDHDRWETLINEQVDAYLPHHIPFHEPETPPYVPNAPKQVPFRRDAQIPYVPASVTDCPDGRSGEALNDALTLHGITLLNKQHWVNDRYRPVPDEYDRWGLIDEARAAFDEMKEDAAKIGLTLVFASGYRSYELQGRLFTSYSENNPEGEAGANRGSARPGQSEHHTGLALDIRNETDGLTPAFGESPEGKWLWANAWRYGWILRYPQGKEHITGYKFEPWHYRYVGKEVAKDFGAYSTLTLEEYLGDTLSLLGWMYDPEYELAE